MRVDKLFLPDFRNLQDFYIDFDEDSPRTVIIGRNGVGKTNILEALTSIFRQLDLRAKPSFPYKLNYTCNGFIVEVEASADTARAADGVAATFTMTYKVSLQAEESGQAILAAGLPLDEVSEAAFYRMNADTRLLPKHVFGYYSGTSSRLRDLFLEHTENYRDALIAGEEETIRPLFLAEDWHSQFVLLAFYSKHDPEIRSFLLEQLGIEDLESVLFILQEPYWYKRDASVQVRERGDERYWWAAGTVKRLLAELHRVALAPMKTTERVQVGIKRYQTKERRYCYLKSADDLIALAADVDQKELFKRLESAVLSDLLHAVRIRFRIKNSDRSLTFIDLSEGEQQLLTVLGLLRFTNQDESLFLLDEPDTHLNPAWCLDYLDILTKYGGGLSKSQIIMTTHGPLVFAGLEKNEVIILKRREMEQRIEAGIHPRARKGWAFPRFSPAISSACAHR
jgi:predicted ATPase